MKPILSPWVVYLGQIFGGLNGLAIAACMIGGIVVIVGIVFYIIISFDDYGTKCKDSETTKKCIKKFLLLFIAGLIGVIFVPDKDTYYGMVASSYITSDAITAVTNYGKDVVDYIFEKMKGEEDD